MAEFGLDDTVRKLRDYVVKQQRLVNDLEKKIDMIIARLDMWEEYRRDKIDLESIMRAEISDIYKRLKKLEGGEVNE